MAASESAGIAHYAGRTLHFIRMATERQGINVVRLVTNKDVTGAPCVR
jgi:hypothetical protein